MKLVKRNGIAISDYAPKISDNNLYRGWPQKRPAVHNGVRDGDIITEGLVMYAPLWMFKGNSFKTADKFKYTFVNTGATNSPLGKVYDGDDYQKLTAANFRSADTKGTWQCWLRYGVTGKYYFSSADEATTSYTFGLGRMSSDKISVIAVENTTTLARIRGDTTALVAGNWYFATIISTGTAYQMYVDITSQSLAVEAGDNNGSWFSSVSNRDNAVIGTLINTGATAQVSGIIGEQILYNRPLAASEVARNYQATKWRYT